MAGSVFKPWKKHPMTQNKMEEKMKREKKNNKKNKFKVIT